MSLKRRKLFIDIFIRYTMVFVLYVDAPIPVVRGHGTGLKLIILELFVRKKPKRIPAHGVSIDRRTIGIVSSEQSSKKIKSLVCLRCAQIYTSWTGDEVIARFDKHRRMTSAITELSLSSTTCSQGAPKP